MTGGVVAQPNVAINVWRNADDPSVQWRLTQSDKVTPSEMPEYFELEVYWPGQSEPMTASSQAGSDETLTVVRSTGDLFWRYSLDDSNRIPLGGRATYETFGVSSGRRKFWFGGTVNVGTFRR